MADPGSRKGPSAWTRHSAVGIQFALVIVMFTYGGHWLEQRYDFSPWGTMIGGGLGFLGGTFWLYNEIYTKPEEAKKRSSGDKT